MFFFSIHFFSIPLQCQTQTVCNSLHVLSSYVDADFGTDHPEKAVLNLVISASTFSENVAGMKLKFGKQIKKNLRRFQYSGVNSSLKWRRLQLTSQVALEALSLSLALQVSSQKQYFC